MPPERRAPASLTPESLQTREQRQQQVWPQHQDRHWNDSTNGQRRWHWTNCWPHCNGRSRKPFRVELKDDGIFVVCTPCHFCVYRRQTLPLLWCSFSNTQSSCGSWSILRRLQLIIKDSGMLPLLNAFWTYAQKLRVPQKAVVSSLCMPASKQTRLPQSSKHYCTPLRMVDRPPTWRLHIEFFFQSHGRSEVLWPEEHLTLLRYDPTPILKREDALCLV